MPNVGSCDYYLYTHEKKIYKKAKGYFQYRMSLREKCPNAEVFLIRIFLYSD